MDIVKPIPATQPSANISYHVTPFGSFTIFSLVTTKNEIRIPKGFPNTNPNPIPNECKPLNPEMNSVLNGMAVLASVNNGRIINATGKCKRCCNLMEGVFSSPEPKGQAKANKTPEIVG